MSDKFIGLLFNVVIRIAADRLIAFFKLENVVELVTTFGGLAIFIFGAVAYFCGWM